MERQKIISEIVKLSQTADERVLMFIYYLLLQKP